MYHLVHLSIALYTALQYRRVISSNSLLYNNSGGISSSPAAFLFVIFLRTESSSCVNSPSLRSSWLSIIFVIGSCVTFEDFPSIFSKCCYYRCIRSSWLVAFSLAFVVLFLWFSSFTSCHTILDSSRFNRFFNLIDSEVFFMSVRFFLTANVTTRTLGLALCLLGMNCAAAS